LRAASQAIETWLATHGLPSQPDTLAKVHKPRAGMAAWVDGWGQTGRQDLTPRAMTPRWTQGTEDVVLPLPYWPEQLRRTRHPGQKPQSALVLRAVAEAFERHPCTRQLTPALLAGGQSWAGEPARACQRASSAVEGRQGSLSPMQPKHRGLPMRRSPGWTVLHHFAWRAADGTTPAARFCRREFPDLFESVLSQIDAFPLPRQRRQTLATSH